MYVSFCEALTVWLVSWTYVFQEGDSPGSPWWSYICYWRSGRQLLFQRRGALWHWKWLLECRGADEHPQGRSWIRGTGGKTEEKGQKHLSDLRYVLSTYFMLSHFQNFVYAVGGNDGVASLSSVERFNPHLNKWTEVCEMGQRRAGNGVSKLNGCLYVVGKRNCRRTLVIFFSTGWFVG